MPRHIIRIRDHYLLWSDVIDAPVGICNENNLDSLCNLYFYDREPSKAELEFFDKLVERIKHHSTSHPELTSVEDFVRFNRAGPGERRLTVDEIYKVYCLKQPLEGWSPHRKIPS